MNAISQAYPVYLNLRLLGQNNKHNSRILEKEINSPWQECINNLIKKLPD